MNAADREFAERVWTHQPALLQIARRRHLGSPDDAEDLVGTVILRAIQQRSRFRPGTNLGAWLHIILRNASIDAYRRHHEDLPLWEWFGARDADPADVVADRRLIAEGLANLTSKQRRVARLVAAGYKHHEIAELTGISRLGISTLACRGRQRAQRFRGAA